VRLGLKLPTVVQVAGLVPEGPAHRAGIEPGDILCAADDQPIGSMDDLYRVLSSRPPTQPLRVRVVRDLKPMELTVQVEEEKRLLGGGGTMPQRQRLQPPEAFRPASTGNFQFW